MPLSVRSRLSAGLAAGVLAVATPVAATAATAATAPGSNNPQQVPAGILAPEMRGASAFGNTPASTPEQVSFILKERNISALKSAVTGGLKNFDSVGQFAAKYGQTSDVVSALTSYLASFGITTAVYPGNVDVSASGTAGEFDKALSVTQKNYHVPAQPGFGGHKIKAQSVYSATGAPELPSGLAQYVLAILGLTNYSPFSTNLVHGNAAESTSSSSSTGDQAPNYLPRDFAATYGLDPLYRHANGSGKTIGIVTLAALDPGAPQYFWQNVAGVPNTGRTVTVDNVDGGPGAPSDASGSGETDLDVEQSGGLAPGANVIVYQAPNSDPGFVDAFFSAASQNAADTLSASWGEAEDVITIESAAGRRRLPTRLPSTRRSSSWPTRARRSSTPRATRAPTTTPTSSGPPTCRSTLRRTVPTPPRPAARRRRLRRRLPVPTGQPRSPSRSSAPGAGTTSSRRGQRSTA